MEDPLLSKTEHIVNITNDGNSSSGVESSDRYKIERFWNRIEFVINLVQIAVALVVLIQPKDKEHPQTTLSIWIIGYTCGSIATLPILCWRFWFYYQSVSSESTRINNVMDMLKMVLEGFFVGWFMVYLWNFMANPSSLDDTTTEFFWLCAALLTFCCIRYVLINLTCAVICYFLPGILCVLAVEEVLKVILTLIGRFLACINR